MDTIQSRLTDELTAIRDAGLYKDERVIESPQSAEITVGGRTVLNFRANNYLGLPEPSFEEDNNGFRLTFISDPYKPERLEEMGLGPRQLQIIKIVREKKEISLPDLMVIFPGFTDRTIRRDLKSLVEKNLLRAKGAKKDRSYTPI